MDVFLYLVKSVVYFALSALQTAMFLRAILSWFPGVGDRLYDFLCTLTEPFIGPVRLVLDKFESLKNLPIDMAFLVTFILLSLVQSVLSVFF